MPYPFVAAEVLTAANLNAMIGAPTQNAINDVTYTAALLDAGKTVTLSNASAVTLTIPAQASVAWAANTQLNFLNLGAGTVTITPAADVTINGEPLTLATSKGGSLVRTASNTWTFIPFSGGVEAANANFTNTATGTYTDDEGIDYKYITFAGSGDLIVDQAGFADILVVGGGGSGGYGDQGGSAGAGGLIHLTSILLPAMTLTVVVGSGGAGVGTTLSRGNNGNNSQLWSLIAVGGGYGGGSSGGAQGGAGGSGGGGILFGNGTGAAGGAGVAYQGNAGGTGGQGGGGGAGGAASGGTRGAGLSVSITGAAVTYARGGQTSDAAGAANTGNGGGGGSSSTSGGSGLVIVRVRTN